MKFSFTKHSKKFMIVSAAVLLIGLVCGIFMGGFNLGIDFTGGSIITVDLKQTYEIPDVQTCLSNAGETGFTVFRLDKTGEGTQVQMRIRPQADEATDIAQRDAIMAKLHEVYPEAELSNVERIGAVASASLIKNALLAVGIAGVLILIYISIRFEFHFGVSALLCLLHDVLMMMAFVCIFRVEINSSFIAAVLTIVGYSINNTIVVFDRMRENRAALPDLALDELVDTSLHQTLTRSIYTSLTTLITILALYILGPSSIKEFAFPIIVGLLAGTYSSLFLAAPIWDLMVQKSSKASQSGVPMDKQAKKAAYEKNKNTQKAKGKNKAK